MRPEQPLQVETTLYGQVTDQETGDPLPGVNVFLAGTMLGAATDSAGMYTMPGVLPGRYELIASILGYATASVEIEIQPGVTQQRVDFTLEAAVYRLDGLAVAAERPPNWDRYYEIFENEFLGNTSNGRATEIMNPFVLDFEMEDGTLVARAAEPLILQNSHMGYRVTFILESFRFNASDESLLYQGYPYFETLAPTEDTQVETWETNRFQTYNGSLQHFLWALVHDRVRDEGFRVREDSRFNPSFVPEHNELRSVTAREIARPSPVPGLYRLQFNHYLLVAYEPEEAQFSLRRNEPSGLQLSWLRINGLSGMLYQDGTLYPPDLVTASGDMALRRMADRLPREYIRQFKAELVQQPEPVAESTPELEPVQEWSRSLLQDPLRIFPPANDRLLPTVETMRTGNWTDAVPVLDQMLQADSTHLEARYYRALVHRNLAATGDSPDHEALALADFEYILRQDSTYRDVLYQYARFSETDASPVSPTMAIKLEQAQARLRPDVAEHRFHLYKFYRRFINRTAPDEALAWLERQASDYAHYFRGEVMRKQGRLEEAEQVFTELLGRPLRMPRQPILLSRARIYYSLQRPEYGEVFVREAIHTIRRRLHASFVLEDVKYLLNEQDLEIYGSLRSAEDYITFFDAFWTRRDPTPARTHNVRMAEHYQRLLDAEQSFAFDGYRPWLFGEVDQVRSLTYPDVYRLNGEFDDMGLIYIRHGTPVERVATPGQPSDLPDHDRGILAAEQSPRARWVPNESWRYTNPDMDFHFVRDSPEADWRIASVLPNLDMLRDRSKWGGIYADLFNTAEQADGDLLDAFEALDFSADLEKWAAQSQEALMLGLTTDRFGTDDTVDALEFPFVAAAFRGEAGLTDLQIHYALPMGRIKRATSVDADSLDIEVGFALHDSTWATQFKHAGSIRIPFLPDTAMSATQTIQLSVPPNRYYVSLHGRVTDASMLGRYRFIKEVSDYYGSGLSVSDILLADAVNTPASRPPRYRSDVHLEVNPLHRFVRNTPVHVYFEIYELEPGVDQQTTYRVTYRLIPRPRVPQARSPFTQLEKPVRTETYRRKDSLPTAIELIKLDLASLETGRYTLEINIVDETTGQEITRRTLLDVTSTNQRYVDF